MSTKFQTIRQEPLSAVIETRTALLHAASQLSLEAQDTVFLGVWSVVDLIANLFSCDFTNPAAAKDIQAGKQPCWKELSIPTLVMYMAATIRMSLRRRAKPD
jgi:hypothetical protein